MTREQPVGVLIVEAFDIMQRGLRDILDNSDNIKVIADATDIESALTLCRSLHFDVVLMDADLPDSDGLTAVQILCESQPHLPIIVLIHPDCYQLTDTIMQAGALGCLTKNVSAQELIRATRKVASGKPVIIQYSSRTDQQEQPPADLTEREKAVLSLLVHGLTNRQIAGRLEVSRYTVKNHISHLFSKLNVTSRTEAAMVALKHGIVQID